jgi:hypothetical protein
MSLYPEKPPLATEIECQINNRIMGACNHPDCSIEEERSYGHTYEVAICSECGARKHLSGSSYGVHPDPLMELKSLIPRHCQDMVMIRRVLRHMEDHGWRWSTERRDGEFLYSISNGVRKFDGVPSRVELEAICSAIATVAAALPSRSGA